MARRLPGTFKDIFKIISLGVLAAINGGSDNVFAMDDRFSDEEYFSGSRNIGSHGQDALGDDEALAVALALSRAEGERSRFAREFPVAAAQDDDAAFRRALELSREETTRSHFASRVPVAAYDAELEEDLRRVEEFKWQMETVEKTQLDWAGVQQAREIATPTNDDELVHALEASRIQAEEDEALLRRVLRESAEDAFRPAVAAEASGYDVPQQYGWLAEASGYDASQQYGWPAAAASEDDTPYQPWRPKFVASDDSEDEDASFEKQTSTQTAHKMAIPQLGGQDDEQTPALFSNQQSIFPMKDGKFQIPDKMWTATELANKEEFKKNIRAQIDVFFAEADDDKSEYFSEADWMKQKAIPALEIKLRAQNKGAGVSRAIHEILKDIFPGLVS